MKQKLLSLICLSFLIIHTSWAQESMLSDVSYPYLEKLIDIAKKNYPEVKVKERLTAIAKNNITKTDVNWLDAFNFSYFYRPADKNVVNPVDPYIFNGYQLGVNINLGTLLAKPFATKEAKEQYQVAQFQQQEYNLSIEAEVKKRYFTYLEQISLLKLRTKSTADANDVVKQMKYKFEKGEAKFDEYNSALIIATDQNQYKIQAEGGVFMAKASLEEIIGDKLENVK
jgi:outer membrane protein TolC